MELGEEFVEFLAVFRGDDELGGGESVFARILRGAGLTLAGAGAGAEAGIGGVGSLTSFGKAVFIGGLVQFDCRVRGGGWNESGVGNGGECWRSGWGSGVTDVGRWLSG